MPGDISRETFRREKHYSGVRMQQGRVQVDSDQNEQLAIEEYRTETETTDVVGTCGVPEDIGGFQIGRTADGGDLTIQPGQIFVEGLLAEVDASSVPITFPQLQSPPAPPFGSPSGPANRVKLTSLVIDDRRLKAGDWVEISARNQAATQFRVNAIDSKNTTLFLNGSVAAFQNAAEPKLRRIVTYTTQPDDFPDPRFISAITSPATSPSSGGTRLNLADGTYVVYVDVWKREITALDDPHIREVALNGPDTATRSKTVWQVRILPVTPASPTLCDSVFPEWDSLIAPPSGTMNARTVPAQPGTDPCKLPPGAGFQRLENQLYRVEIQKGGATRAGCTFKSSREDASVESTIENIANNVITVKSLGKDEVLGFANDQWVEIVDEESELKHAPRPLLQIDQVKPATREILMKGSVPQLGGRPGLKLRRWEQSGTGATQDGVAMGSGWIELEGGIQVLFSEGSFQAGDFWLIPARTATADIEWPPFEVPNVNPIPQPPFGIRHHFCRLAILIVSGGVMSTPLDCRNLFPPLTRVLKAAKSVHVQQIFSVNSNNVRSPLVNDVPLLIPQFAGIDAVCDQNLAAFTVKRPTCFVTVEAPIPGGYTSAILAAAPTATGPTISWRPSAAALQLLNSLQIPSGDPGILTRFTLKGNFIWSAKDPNVLLDGEVFGVRGSAGSTISARLPSGNRIAGGDLDVWFWLARPAPPPPFQLTLGVNPGALRSEGLTELLPDIVLSGSGGNPTPVGSNVPEYNITLFFNTAVTNSVANGLTDAVLMVCDDPAVAGQPAVLNTTRFNTLTPPVPGVGGSGVNFQDGSAPNIFQGRMATAGTNTLVFNGVPIDPPGFATRVLRIKNVRLGAPAGASGPSSPLVLVTLQGNPAIPLSNPQANVGFTLNDVDFAALTPVGAIGPVHIPVGPINPGLLTGSTQVADTNFLIRFRELFASSFKIRKGASDNPFELHLDSESGYGNSGPGALTIKAGNPLPTNFALANSGTQLQATFTNIPQGMQVFVTTRDVPASAGAPPKALIVNPVLPPGGTGLTTNGIPIVQLPITAGAVVAVWEVQSVNPAQNEDFNFAVVLAAASAGATGTPPPTVSGELAPVATTSLVIPRFAPVTRNQTAFIIP
jgi:hypothetical protein